MHSFFQTQEKSGYIHNMSKFVCIMIFVALSSDLVSCFLWLVWVWAAKLCHVPVMCRGPGFCDKNTLRYISWHYNQKHDQCHTPHDQLAYSLIPTIGKNERNWKLKPTKCISLLLFFNNMNMKTSFKDLLNLLITFSSYQTFIIRNNFTIYLSLKYCKKSVEP